MDAKDLAYKDYLAGMKYKEIAEKYGVSLNTVKSWKQRNSWDRKGCTQKDKKGAHKKTGVGAPKGNKNAVGNSGGAAPVGNKNAEKHGFFSKWLPPETLSIMQEIEEKTPADMLWDQIMIQYTAIIRAQRLMYVKDQQDLSKEITMKGEGITSWDVQQAWDKQSKFLQAQSRAMQTLNGMIAQYEKMLHNSSEDEREERLARIAKIKAETNRLEAGKGTGIGSVLFAGEGDLID